MILLLWTVQLESKKVFNILLLLANEAIVVVNLDVSSLRDADQVVGLLMKKGINTIIL